MSLDRVNAYVKEIGFDVAEKQGRGRTIRYTRLSLKTSMESEYQPDYLSWYWRRREF